MHKFSFNDETQNHRGVLGVTDKFQVLNTRYLRSASHLEAAKYAVSFGIPTCPNIAIQANSNQANREQGPIQPIISLVASEGRYLDLEAVRSFNSFNPDQVIHANANPSSPYAIQQPASH